MFVFLKTLPCSWNMITHNWCFLILKSFVKQLVSTMFINNNHASFCSLLKEKFVRHQKASKYYDQNFECLQNFLLLFISLLSVWIVRNSHISAGIYFIFLKTTLDLTWRTLEIKFAAQWIDQESSYQVRQILGPLCKVVSLILG